MNKFGVPSYLSDDVSVVHFWNSERIETIQSFVALTYGAFTFKTLYFKSDKVFYIEV